MNEERAIQLLKIMSYAKQWPELSALHDIARTELIEANGVAKNELVKRAAERARVLAEEQARVAAKVRADADAQAAAEEKDRVDSVRARADRDARAQHQYNDPNRRDSSSPVDPRSNDPRLINDPRSVPDRQESILQDHFFNFQDRNLWILCG